MTFPITIEYHKKKIRLSVEQLYIDERFERYKITARNGDIVLESNRPLFRGKGLKHRPGTWTQIDGKPLSTHAIELIAEEIQKHVEKK
ncbi:hypothetical protein A4D02_30780 [Niastella koreensis]|uniref:Uncharacterized protein n=1 Tax=Niastella koreensis TaxID=354356 RepID=A0ABX3NV17_9BACT|nr:hypothetical protein [Niastella koreensis]OQP46428.1 hypothetical protein A4D02_30780 [Niastella koreensis]